MGRVDRPDRQTTRAQGPVLIRLLRRRRRRLRYAGKVGSGFDDRELAELQRRFAGLTADRVAFADGDWTQRRPLGPAGSGHRRGLQRVGRPRRPAPPSRFERLREDKAPADVRREAWSPPPPPTLLE